MENKKVIGLKINDYINYIIFRNNSSLRKFIKIKNRKET